MTSQRLSRCVGQHNGHHAFCTARSSAAARLLPLTRSSWRFQTCAQQHFCRSLWTRNTLRTLPAVQAQNPDVSEIETADLLSASDKTQSAEDEAQLPFPGVQADTGVEIISEAVPTEAVLSASVTENIALPAVDSSPKTAQRGDWESVLQSFLDVIKEGSFFEGKAPRAEAFSISVLKKGILNFARARQDILFSLPVDKIQAVLAAGAPYKERKVINSTPTSCRPVFVCCGTLPSSPCMK